jgi:hypothetical protein
MTRLTTLALWALVSVGSAMAAGYAPDKDTFDPKPALLQAARTLYPESQESSPQVTQVQRVERFLDGFRMEIYELGSTKPPRRLVRLQVFPDPVSIVDLVLRVDEKKLAGIQALRPIRFGMRPFTRLHETFAPLKGQPLAQASAGLVAVFNSLALLKQGETPLPPPPLPKPGTPPLVRAVQPKLALGQPIPAFKATTAAGAPVTNYTYRKQLVMFVFGSLTDTVSWQMLTAAGRLAERLPKVQYVPVLKNIPAELQSLTVGLNDTELVLPNAILEPTGDVRDAFMVSNAPYLMIFDTAGRLVFRTIWMGRQRLESDVDALLAKGVK